MFRTIFSQLRSFSRRAFSDRYLLVTNVGISISLSGVGDCIEQQYEIHGEGRLNQYDPLRTGQMAVSGMTVGIFCHHWYKFLDHRLPGRSIRQVLKKVLIDQTVASPCVIFLFFVTLGALRRSSAAEIWAEMKDKALTLYTAEWVVWPPAQVLNFYFLPTRFRVLWDNTISLGYDVYTSAVINRPIQQISPS